MINIRISHAGCGDSIIKKLSMASTLFGGRGVTASIAPWSGIKTDVVMTDQSDPYGENVSNIANRHNIPVIHITRSLENRASAPGAVTLYSDLPAIEFLNAIEQLLGIGIAVEPHINQKKAFIDTIDPFSSPVLSHGNAQVFIDYSSGVCRSASHSDMLFVSEAISKELPITSHRIKPSDLKSMECSVSIEYFFFSTLARMTTIEWKKTGPLHLKGWPDIKSRTYPKAPITLATMLLGTTKHYSDLSLAAPQNIVCAFLYATYFCGLLTIEQQQGQQLQRREKTLPPSSSNVFSTLKKWLGI